MRQLEFMIFQQVIQVMLDAKKWHIFRLFLLNTYYNYITFGFSPKTKSTAPFRFICYNNENNNPQWGSFHHHGIAFYLFWSIFECVRLYVFVSKIGCNNSPIFSQDINFTFNYVSSSFSIDNHMFKKHLVTLHTWLIYEMLLI